jgi:hypothetical protein
MRIRINLKAGEHEMQNTQTVVEALRAKGNIKSGGTQ